MACGAPVVLTETDGLWSREQLQEGRNVLFVHPTDAAQLAARICEVIADASTAEKLSREGRSLVEQRANIGVFADKIAEACARQMTARRGSSH
jgi:glycosyltransferase involved in cell wall biosynthesis